MIPIKPRVAVHKFTSCDGCQLAFINMAEELLALNEVVDFIHFAEVGPVNPDAKVDIAFIEGSISTPDEVNRIKKIRDNAKFLITIGACATAGGIQALRNFADKNIWVQAIYPKPDTIHALDTSTAISKHVKVDFEIWGCPVNSRQVLDAIRNLLQKVTPTARRDSVCMECKRLGYVCVMVSQGIPCMGPVTQTGCGALCPGAGRDCYACYGPSENPNTDSLATWYQQQFSLSRDEVKRRFQSINNQAPAFKDAGLKLMKKK